MLATVRGLHSVGVELLAGTDVPNPGTAQGASLHGELELLVEELETGRAQMEVAAQHLADTVAGENVPGARKPVRKPLPEHLPRETVTHAAACVYCPPFSRTPGT